MTWKRSSPYTRHRSSEKAIPEGNDLRSVIEHEPEFQIVSTDVQQLPHPLEVARMDGCACFDFDTDQCAVLIFHEDVDLILILISIVMERITFIRPCGLLHDFGKYKCFKHSTK